MNIKMGQHLFEFYITYQIFLKALFVLDSLNKTFYLVLINNKYNRHTYVKFISVNIKQILYYINV